MKRSKQGFNVISIFLLSAILVLSGCGTVIDTSDEIKVVEINQEDEARRSASSIENYVHQYPQALQFMEDEKYFDAMVILRNLADYKDGRELYNIALSFGTHRFEFPLDYNFIGHSDRIEYWPV